MANKDKSEINELVKKLNEVPDLTSENQENWYNNLFDLLNNLKKHDLDYLKKDNKEKSRIRGPLVKIRKKIIDSFINKYGEHDPSSHEKNFRAFCGEFTDGNLIQLFPEVINSQVIIKLLSLNENTLARKLCKNKELYQASDSYFLFLEDLMNDEYEFKTEALDTIRIKFIFDNILINSNKKIEKYNKKYDFVYDFYNNKINKDSSLNDVNVHKWLKDISKNYKRIKFKKNVKNTLIIGTPIFILLGIMIFFIGMLPTEITKIKSQPKVDEIEIVYEEDEKYEVEVYFNTLLFGQRKKNVELDVEPNKINESQKVKVNIGYIQKEVDVNVIIKPKKLDRPNITLVDGHVLKWDKVEHADKYNLTIDEIGLNVDLTEPYYDLSTSFKDAPELTVSISAFSDKEQYSISDKWTKKFTSLQSPSNIHYENGAFVWDPVPNAVAYKIYMNDEEPVEIKDTYFMHTIVIGENTIRVVAISESGDESVVYGISEYTIQSFAKPTIAIKDNQLLINSTPIEQLENLDKLKLMIKIDSEYITFDGDLSKLGEGHYIISAQFIGDGEKFISSEVETYSFDKLPTPIIYVENDMIINPNNDENVVIKIDGHIVTDMNLVNQAPGDHVITAVAVAKEENKIDSNIYFITVTKLSNPNISIKDGLLEHNPNTILKLNGGSYNDSLFNGDLSALDSGKYTLSGYLKGDNSKNIISSNYTTYEFEKLPTPSISLEEGKIVCDQNVYLELDGETFNGTLPGYLASGKHTVSAISKGNGSSVLDSKPFTLEIYKKETPKIEVSNNIIINVNNAVIKINGHVVTDMNLFNQAPGKYTITAVVVAEEENEIDSNVAEFAFEKLATPIISVDHGIVINESNAELILEGVGILVDNIIPVEKLDAGTYTISAQVSGNGVDKIDSNITTYTIEKLQSPELVIRNGAIISDINARIELNGKEYNASSLYSSSFFDHGKVGLNTLTAQNLGNNKNILDSNVTTLEFTKLDTPTISIVNEVLINELKGELKLDGKAFDGKFTSSLSAGSHTIVSRLYGNGEDILDSDLYSLSFEKLPTPNISIVNGSLIGYTHNNHVAKLLLNGNEFDGNINESLSAGEYTLTAQFIGDGSNILSSNSCDYSFTKLETPILSVENGTLKYPTMDEFDIIFKINGNISSPDLSLLDSGKYEISAYFKGNGTNVLDSNSKTISVEKLEAPLIGIKDNELYINNVAYDKNHDYQNLVLKIKTKDELIDFDFDNLEGGSYAIVAYYHGNELNILDSDQIVYSFDKMMTPDIYLINDELKNPMNSTLKIKVEGEETFKPFDGNVSLLEAGKYTIVSQMLGNGTNHIDSKTCTLVVTKLEVPQISIIDGVLNNPRNATVLYNNKLFNGDFASLYAGTHTLFAYQEGDNTNNIIRSNTFEYHFSKNQIPSVSIKNGQLNNPDNAKLILVNEVLEIENNTFDGLFTGLLGGKYVIRAYVEGNGSNILNSNEVYIEFTKIALPNIYVENDILVNENNASLLLNGKEFDGNITDEFPVGESSIKAYIKGNGVTIIDSDVKEISVVKYEQPVLEINNSILTFPEKAILTLDGADFDGNISNQLRSGEHIIFAYFKSSEINVISSNKTKLEFLKLQTPSIYIENNVIKLNNASTNFEILQNGIAFDGDLSKLAPGYYEFKAKNIGDGSSKLDSNYSDTVYKLVNEDYNVSFDNLDFVNHKVTLKLFTKISNVNYDLIVKYYKNGIEFNKEEFNNQSAYEIVLNYFANSIVADKIVVNYTFKGPNDKYPTYHLEKESYMNYGKLDEPTNFRLQNNDLIWDPVNFANYYVVSFNGESIKVDTNRACILLKEGTNLISIVAYSNGEYSNSNVVEYTIVKQFRPNIAIENDKVVILDDENVESIELYYKGSGEFESLKNFDGNIPTDFASGTYYIYAIRKGNGIDSIDSDYSIIEITKLEQPTIKITNEKVDIPSLYGIECLLNDQPFDGNFENITSGEHTLKVRLLGNGKETLTSDYSSITVIRLDAPELSYETRIKECDRVVVNASPYGSDVYPMYILNGVYDAPYTQSDFDFIIYQAQGRDYYINAYFTSDNIQEGIYYLNSTYSNKLYYNCPNTSNPENTQILSKTEHKNRDLGSDPKGDKEFNNTIGEFKLSGKIASTGTIKGKNAYGASGILKLSFTYDNSYRTEDKNKWFLSNHSTTIGGVSVGGYGGIIVQTSQDGNSYVDYKVHYNNVFNSTQIDICNISHEEYLTGTYYRVILVYRINKWDRLLGVKHSESKIEVQQVYDFYVSVDDGDILFENLDSKPYENVVSTNDEGTIKLVNNGEIITGDVATVVNGFRINKVNKKYLVHVKKDDGEEVLVEDLTEFTESGKYVITYRSDFKAYTKTIYVYNDLEYGYDEYFDNKFIWNASKNGNTYIGNNPYVRLFGRYNTNLPPLNGYIYNTTTGTKIDINNYLINGDPQQILLSSGHYECKFYNGTIGSGSYYEYTYSFEVIKNE